MMPFELSWRSCRPHAWLSRSALIFALAAVLAGCGKPRNVLTPVAETAPGTSQVSMLVATTRLAATSRAEFFTGERGPDLAFADMVISIPPDAKRQLGEVQWPDRLPGNPATDFVTLKAEPLDLAQAKAWFSKAIARSKQRRVLVFVHGYNNRFEEAVYRFAQIMHDSAAPAVPILFTWPSRGTLLSYNYDRESTNYSRDALETVLQALAKDPAVGEVSILAHSMGNWLVLESLRQMAIRNGSVAPKIKSVILAAPDVDVDVFRKQIALIGDKKPRFTLFVSQDDRALAISRRVSGGVTRLGAINPEEEPFKSELAREKITVLDLTKLRGGDSLNHGKFAESPEVVQLIGQRLIDGQNVGDPQFGLADRLGQITTGAAATIGSTAGLIVTAPIAIIDPNSRENLGTRVQELGGGLADTAGGTAGIITDAPRNLGVQTGQGRRGARPGDRTGEPADMQSQTER